MTLIMNWWREMNRLKTKSNNLQSVDQRFKMTDL